MPPASETLAQIQRTPSICAGFVDAKELFAEGYCDRLAYALKRALPGSMLVGLYSDLDKRGDPIEPFMGTLVHGAVRLGGVVLDIHGHCGLDEWKARWQGARPLGTMTMADQIREPSLDPLDHWAQEIAHRLVRVWKRDGVLASRQTASDSIAAIRC